MTNEVPAAPSMPAHTSMTITTEVRADSDGQLNRFDEATRVAPLRRRALATIALGEVLDGFDLVIVGSAILLLRPEFHLGTGTVGWLGAITAYGAVLGLLVGGSLTDRLGRRQIFVINLWVFIVFALLSAFATQIWEILACRAMVGVAIGTDIATSMSFLTELAPRRSRGRWTGALSQVGWCVGALIAVAVALLFVHLAPHDGWRWMFGVGAIPAFVILVLRRQLPESPRWLMLHGRDDEAREAMAQLGVEPDVVETATRPQRSFAAGSYLDIFRAPNTRRAIIVLVVLGLTPISGAITSTIGPYVLATIGFGGTTAALQLSLLSWGGSVCGALIAFAYIDRIGRLNCAAISLFGNLICAVVLILVPKTSVVFPIAYILYGALTFFGASSFWALPGELLPTSIRGRAQGVGNGLSRVLVGTVSLEVPPLLAAIGFTGMMISIGTVAGLIGLFALSGKAYEPNGRRLEESTTAVGHRR